MGIEIASADGLTGLETKADGEPVQAGADEHGRVWTRLWADGDPISSTNPIPVTLGGQAAAIQVVGNVANNAVDSGNPVKVGAVAVASVDTGAAQVAAGDRVDLIAAVTGQLGVQAVGSVANDAVDAGNPLKVGGVATVLAGQTAVAAGDRANHAMTTRGQALVALAGGALWTKSSTVLNTPVKTKLIYTGAAQVGRVSITNVDATACYCYVYDGTSNVAGVLIDMFYVPASGTAVRDYTTEGGVAVTTGLYLELSLSAVAASAVTTGAHMFGIYQAGA
jgi:hypothetical protein